MKRTFHYILAAFLFMQLAHAQTEKTSASVSKPGDLALGLILGSPTGVSLKYWTSRRGAVDAALGFPFDSDIRFNVHSDYLWQFPINANVPGELPFYVGVGGRLRAIDRRKHSQKIDFGIRIPVGLEFSPRNVPLNFFAELAPVIVFTPSGELNLDGGIGIRYRFG